MKLKKFLYSEKVAPYIFVIPFILSFAFFWIYPLITSVTMSFQDIGAIKSEWVGLANYQKLLKDNVFHTAIWNSTKYMLFTLVLLIPFPMLFAVLMDSRLVKAKGVWKAILYMPALTSVVISGTLFRLMFTEYSTGQMNIITAALGLGTYKWLKMGWSGMTALLVVACWRWTGVNMLYFLSGLKAIDSSLYEASEIDGASAWQKFRYVTLPLLKPTRRSTCSRFPSMPDWQCSWNPTCYGRATTHRTTSDSPSLDTCISVESRKMIWVMHARSAWCC